MIVSVTFDVDTDEWAEAHDTEGMTASEVRRDIRDLIDRVVREDDRTAPFMLPGLMDSPRNRR